MLVLCSRRLSICSMSWGRPDEYFDCIQVAGTNGKTSSTRFSAAILRGEGLKTALYTSPQLVRYPERMEVDGRGRER